MKKEYTLPKTLVERVDRLQDAKNTLKAEFMGLDDVIDSIIDSISTWYLTPELISRPVVVSLWGMTGTGKSSVVRRLIEILGVSGSSLTFDCGECTSSNKNITSDISDSFGSAMSDFESPTQAKVDFTCRKPVFIFDEFQYARTLNERGEEEVNSSLRPIWTLMDSGIIDITDFYDYMLSSLLAYIEDLSVFAKDHPDIIVEKNMIKKSEEVKIYLESLGFMHHFGRNIPGITSTSSSSSKEESDDDPYKEIELLNHDRLKALIRFLNRNENLSGFEASKKLLSSVWPISEFANYLEGKKSILSMPKRINCSNALIFVIGNLDEAYIESRELSPDIDADMFYDITSRITINDIKEALKSRFRPEQIARLGNNLIKYPTLKKEHFKKILDLELTNVIKRFNVDYPKFNITVSDNIKELLYSEGVYPTQGVRPLFTTMGTILTPFFSRIVVLSEEEDRNIVLDTKDTNFRKDEVEITLSIEKKTYNYPLKLQLGSLRNPKNRKKRYISSVHEAGHAIIYAYTRGIPPISIVSVSVDDGGFCTNYDKEMDREIRSRYDLESQIMLSFGGYLAEQVIYGDRPEMCLLGSGSDISSIASEAFEAMYHLGYFTPLPITCRKTETTAFGALPSGFDEDILVDLDNIGMVNLNKIILDQVEHLKTSTKRILVQNKDLIKKLALYLGEYGIMDDKIFMYFVSRNDGTLTVERMTAVRNEYGPDYYEKVLRESK